MGADDLLPERLIGSEGINVNFHFELDLLATPSTTIDPKSIVGSKCCVTIQASAKGDVRYINGYIMGFEMYGGDEEFNRYRAHIVPNIWLLGLNENTRVFQDKNVIDVVKAVLSTYNITFEDSTTGNHPVLDYCTQYRETDLRFVQRLLEEFGICYYFVHSKDDHKLTLQDKSTSLDDCPIKSSFSYAPQGHKTAGFYDFVFSEFKTRNTMATSIYTAWDHAFVGNAAVLESYTLTTPLGTNQNELYDYMGGGAGYTKKSDNITVQNIKTLTDGFNKVLVTAHNARTAWLASGTSNAICLQAGYNATLTDHPQSPLNDKYLITYIEHEVQQVPTYRSRTADPAEPYSNKFKAIPSGVVYRPPMDTPKPVVQGMHTGLVVTPSGEDSYMDKYGRVCVQFWWDRLRKPNTPDNTLLRVAQTWAGKGWGTYFWPRVGDEVLIGFMEGDPNQPIVVGSVYNGVNMPKYDPAGQYTLSGILTRSSKGGAAANANELRFEDLDGKEQIFMNAERDYTLHVEHDWQTLVGNEQHTKITSNRFDEVDGDSHLLVKGKHLEEIDGENDLNVKGNQIISVGGNLDHTVSGNLKENISGGSDISVGSALNEKVGSTYSLTTGQNFEIQAGMNCDVTAPMQITLNCGPNSIVLSPEGIGLNGAAGFISIGPAGVTISGVMVMINSGGAPVTGSPGSAQSPQSPGSPTAPTAPQFPGDAPPSQPATASSSSSSSSSSNPSPTTAQAKATTPVTPASPPAGGAAAGAAGAAAGAAGGAANQAQQAAQQAAAAAQTAANEAQQAAQQAEQAAQQTAQQAQAAANQVVAQARQEYQQAEQAAQQAQQAANQAVGQAQQQAQQAANQAEQQAQQAAQAASQAAQQAQQQAQQVTQQAQQTAQQAQQAAQQAQQQAQQAAQQAQQAGQQAAQQGQQAAQQAQQAAQQAQQQAQQAAQQAQQAAQQAQQQAQQAQKQVTQAASGAQQQAQQASQAAQQSAQQATNAAKGI
jgi:type VI secretion system secreted protein VgrG